MKSLKSLALISIILLTSSATYAIAPSIKNYNWEIVHEESQQPISKSAYTIKSDLLIWARTTQFQKTDGSLGCLREFDFAIFGKTGITYQPTKIEHQFDEGNIVEIDCTLSAETQDDMNQCTLYQAQHSEQQLKKLLTKLKLLLDDSKELLTKIEKLNNAWEQFRDQYCLREKALFGFGAVAPMVYHNCITFCNTQRTERLKKILCENYRITNYCEGAN